MLFPRKWDMSSTVEMLREAKNLLDGFENRTVEENEELFHKTCEEKEIKLGQLMQPFKSCCYGN